MRGGVKKYACDLLPGDLIHYKYLNHVKVAMVVSSNDNGVLRVSDFQITQLTLLVDSTVIVHDRFADHSVFLLVRFRKDR